MKSILLFLSMLTGCSCLAQAQDFAFKECLASENPAACTREKIDADITALVNQNVQRDFSGQLPSPVLCTAAFVADEKGNILPDETTVYSFLVPLEKAIRNYILSLPQMSPVNAVSSKAAFLVSYAFLPDASGTYYIASQREIWRDKIKIIFPAGVSYPKSKDCKEPSPLKPMDCFLKGFYEKIKKEYKIPPVGNTGQMVLYVHTEIDKNGNMSAKEIYGGTPVWRDEAIRVFSKMPKFTPSQYRGLPVAITFTVPLTINITE